MIHIHHRHRVLTGEPLEGLGERAARRQRREPVLVRQEVRSLDHRDHQNQARGAEIDGRRGRRAGRVEGEERGHDRPQEPAARRIDLEDEGCGSDHEGGGEREQRWLTQGGPREEPGGEQRVTQHRGGRGGRCAGEHVHDDHLRGNRAEPQQTERREEAPVGEQREPGEVQG